MKKLNKVIQTICMIYIVTIIILTPILAYAAYNWRGYFAIGGEYMPLITVPFAVWAAQKKFKKF